MVNVVAHRVDAAIESDGDIESQEGDQNEVIQEVNQQTFQSCFGDRGPKNSTDKTVLSKKLIKSFGAVTKIKRTRKNNSGKMEKFLSEMSGEKLVRYSLKQLKIIANFCSSPLGFGGFGRVYKGELPSGVQVAVKILQDTSCSSEEEQFMSEVSILGRTYHRNIIRLFGFCFENNTKALVYEYMVNGSLDKILFDNHLRIGWESLYHIAIGTAKGISYLHEDCQQTIVHYDIKPGNILLDSNFSPKVADFGLAEMYDRDISHATPINPKGTFGYVAPELYMSSQVTSKCDVYSFGMMLFEIVRRKRNIGGHQSMIMSHQWFPQQVWDKFEKGKLEELLAEHGITEKYRQHAKRMYVAALWCVQYIPENRPSMSTVVNILKGELEAKEPPNPFLAFSDINSGVSTFSGSEVVQGMDYTQSL